MRWGKLGGGREFGEMADQSVNANINWPLVAGLGIAAAVLFYALHIVNNQLNQADALLGGAAQDVQSVVSPITAVTNFFSNAINGVSSWFSSGDTGSSDGQ